VARQHGDALARPGAGQRPHARGLRFCGSCPKISEGVGLGIPFLGALTRVAGIAQGLQVIGVPKFTA
jgi:hypothetical protein